MDRDRHDTLCSRLLVGASLVASCGGAPAQPLSPAAGADGIPEHVDVLAPVRLDVATLCPDVGQALPDELAATARRGAVGAVVHVRFLLEGDRVDQVSVRGGPLQYRNAVRRAVRWLDCRGNAHVLQDVRLQVRFEDPFARAPAPASGRQAAGARGGARALATLANEDAPGR